MLALSYEAQGNPDWSSLETPWEPQEIAWRHDSQRLRHEALWQQIVTSATHLVREVLVCDDYSYNAAPTRTQALATIEKAEAQFDRLQSFGIHTPYRAWHVFEGPDGNVRTLARVRIIRGYAFKPLSIPDFNSLPKRRQSLHTVLDQKIKGYYEATAQSEALSDAYHTEQYIHGRPRGEDGRGIGQPLIYLVDIEPLFEIPLDR